MNFISSIGWLMAVMFGYGTQAHSSYEPIAVVELFTSQGCSSCPPADLVLSQTKANANKEGKKIFTLSFHVDYWNRLGWADPFSDKKYSDRQSTYGDVFNSGRIYTPQMIVNGRSEFVGSDRNALKTALDKALKLPAKVNFSELRVIQDPDKSLHVYYKLEGDYSNSKINVALISLSETTSVKRGENEGRTLTNENVVRQFVSLPASASGEINFALTPAPATGNRSVIAFVQRNDDLEIVGAAAGVE